jgi:hypothetical protein
MPTAYALVALNILCIYLCYQVAANRNADARFWGFMGLFFGPLALPFVFLAKAKDKYYVR